MDIRAERPLAQPRLRKPPDRLRDLPRLHPGLGLHRGLLHERCEQRDGRQRVDVQRVWRDVSAFRGLDGSWFYVAMA